MTLPVSRAVVTLALAAASASAHAGEKHNLILLVPEVLPAASVNSGTAPTLHRLRTEGVDFINTRWGLAKLSTRRPDLNEELLAAAAASAEYWTALIEQPSEIEAVLVRFRRERSYFLLIPRVRESNCLQSTEDALARIESTLKDVGLYEATSIIVVAKHGKRVGAVQELRTRSSDQTTGLSQRRAGRIFARLSFTESP